MLRGSGERGRSWRFDNSGRNRIWAANAMLILAGLALYSNKDEDVDGDGMPDAYVAKATAK